MRKLIAILAFVLCMAGLDASAAKKITVNVIPQTAKIYVDGQLVGTGSYQLKFDRHTDFYVVKVEDVGYLSRTYRLRKDNPKNTVLYSLPKDDAMEASVGSEEGGDLANRWLEVNCRKGMTEDKVWKRLMSVATTYFDDVEVRDKTAGWIKTAWKRTSFRYQTVRTRLEVRMSFKDDEELSYKARISVQIKDNDCKGNNCYKNYDRVITSFEPMIQELQTVVGGGE